MKDNLFLGGVVGIMAHLNEFMRMASGYRPPGTIASTQGDDDEDDQPHGYSEAIPPSVSLIGMDLKYSEIIHNT